MEGSAVASTSSAARPAPAKNGKRIAAMQLLLFRSRGQYYVKADHSAIPISDASSFTDAAEFLFMCFYVFWVEYPFELRLFYVCFEQLLGLKMSIKSSILSDFNRRLKRFMQNSSDENQAWSLMDCDFLVMLTWCQLFYINSQKIWFYEQCLCILCDLFPWQHIDLYKLCDNTGPCSLCKIQVCYSVVRNVYFTQNKGWISLPK